MKEIKVKPHFDYKRAQEEQAKEMLTAEIWKMIEEGEPVTQCSNYNCGRKRIEWIEDYNIQIKGTGENMVIKQKNFLSQFLKSGDYVCMCKGDKGVLVRQVSNSF